jgi:hypothetical protein
MKGSARVPGDVLILDFMEEAERRKKKKRGEKKKVARE